MFFRLGGGFIFKLGVCTMGGITYDGGGGFEKNGRMGGIPLMAPPHYGKPFIWKILCR